MSPGVANFIFEALNFLLLAALLGYVLWKPVRHALEQEQQRYDAQQTHAEEAQRKAEAALQAAQQTQAGAAQLGQAQRDELLAAARKQAEQIVEQARQTQVAMREATQRELARTQAAQVEALADSVARLAAASVRSLLVQLEGPQLDAALVRGACAELQAMPEAARAHALVESAHELDEPARALLEQTLGSPLQIRTVRELGAGVRVTTAQGQVDATAVALTRQAAEALREVHDSIDVHDMRGRDAREAARAAPGAEQDHA